MSLKKVVYREICSKVFDPLFEEGTWRILVLDDITTKILSHVMKMSDIFDRGITHVDDVYKKREPVPLEAIYFLSPSISIMEKIVSDFETNQTYRNIHLFFTDELSDNLLQMLGQSVAANYVLTLKELYIQYLIKESQLFILDLNDRPKRLSLLTDEMYSSWARSLASMCEILNENPSIHFQNTESATKFSNYLKKEMEGKLMENPSLGQAIHRDKSVLLILDRSIDPLSPLLHDLYLQSIAYDLLNIENDTYCYKNLETDKICRVILSEDDAMWQQMRHSHMADVSRVLPMKLKQLANAQKNLDVVNTDSSNAAVVSSNNTGGTAAADGSATLTGNNSAAGSGGNITKQLRLMMKKMPHIRQEVTSVSNLFHLSEACFKAYQDGLNQLCECEQDLAMGTDASSEPIKNHDRLVGNVLNSTLLTQSEKIRLLLILLLTHNGISDLSVMELIQKFRINEKIYKIFAGLSNLGQFINNHEIPRIIPTKCYYLMTHRRQLIDIASYTISRWIPFVKDLMEDTISGRQTNPSLIRTCDPLFGSSTTYPSSAGDLQICSYSHLLQQHHSNTLLPPQTQAQQHQRLSWAAHTSTDDDLHVGPRLIVFILGGVTYSETRLAYEITKMCQSMKAGISIATPNLSRKNHGNSSGINLENGGGRGWNWEVLIGGSCILTPELYLEHLEGN